MNLSNDDVRDIVSLLDSLPYDELRLRTASFALTLRRTADGMWTQEAQVLSQPRVDGAAGVPEPTADGPGSAEARGGPETAGDAVRASGSGGTRNLREVRAPLVGTFYRAPRPGAPPFVEVGDDVDDGTVVGIVETMKLMNPVYAGVSGAVAEICLADAQFTEQDTVLMRVEAP